MFARVFALLPVVALVSAGRLAARDSECSNGKQYCCDNFIDQGETFYPEAHSLIDVLVGVVGGVQLTCSALTIDGCNDQTVCCNNVEQNGLVNVACSPIGVAA